MKDVYIYNCESNLVEKDDTFVPDSEIGIDAYRQYIVDGYNDYKPVGPAYLDKYGIMYVDEKPYLYMFCVEDDDWTEITGNVGQLLDEEDFTTETADAMDVLAKVYEHALTLI